MGGANCSRDAFDFGHCGRLFRRSLGDLETVAIASDWHVREETLDKTKSDIFDGLGRRLRQRRAFGLVLIVAVMTVGCSKLPPAAIQQKLDAEVAYRNRNYNAATETLDAFLVRYPDHPDSAEAYYLRALCRAQQSNKYGASADAQQCIRLSSHSGLTAKAEAMTATLLFETGKEAAALPHYAKALKGLDDEPPTDLVRYRYAICLQHQGQWRDARLEFAAVYQRYPQSACAPHAKQMYEWPHDAFSIQCGAFRDKHKAEQLTQQLKRAGLSVRIEPRTRSSELLQFVYVGRYTHYDQAQHALRTVRRHVSDAIIRP